MDPVVKTISLARNKLMFDGSEFEFRAASASRPLSVAIPVMLAVESARAQVASLRSLRLPSERLQYMTSHSGRSKQQSPGKFGDRAPDSSDNKAPLPWLTRSVIGFSLVPARRCRRRPVLETLVQPFLVVEPEVSLDSGPRFRQRLVVFQVHLLIFERPPQPLDENVVHASAASVHADGNLPGRQFAGELLTGELRTLVRIENLRSAPPQGALQRLDAEVEFQAHRQSPAQDIPAEPVHHSHQVREAPRHP